ncbi:MAG: hypothetical protein KGP10_08795 [Actinomycetales bacterium]|nr:hypothetical protein [Actinomycetales bacterium]
MPVASRALRRHRRLVAAILAGLAVLLLTPIVRPPGEGAGPVVLAARDLRTDQVLTESDLVASRLPAGCLLPGGFTDPTALIGRRLATGVLAGEQVLTMRLQPPADSRPAPIVLPLPVSGLPPLRAGDRVDVLGVPKAGGLAMVIARDLVIASDPLPSATTNPGVGVVLVEVSEAVALRLTGATGRMSLTVALRR